MHFCHLLHTNGWFSLGNIRISVRATLANKVKEITNMTEAHELNSIEIDKIYVIILYYKISIKFL